MLKCSLALLHIVALSGCLCTRGQHMPTFLLAEGGWLSAEQTQSACWALAFVRAMNVRAACCVLALHISLSDKSGLFGGSSGMSTA